MAVKTIEPFNLHGLGEREHEVYEMPAPSNAESWWDAVTTVPCPVEGCTQTVVWFEAGYVPGYRVCLAPVGGSQYDFSSLRHRFLAWRLGENAERIVLIRDDCCEE